MAVQSIRVKVLEAFGPTKFSVRPEVSEGRYYQLQNDLDLHYAESQFDDVESLSSFDEGDSVCVRDSGHWCRAVIVSLSPDQLILSLRLVDVGKIISASAQDVRTIPGKFLHEPGLSIWCHLNAVPLAEVLLPASATSEVLEELPEDKMVEMWKKGVSVQLDSHFSLPVDLTWTKTVIPGPFAQSETVTRSLIWIVLEKMEGHDGLGVTLEETTDGDQPECLEEFPNVSVLRDTEGFRWLPPELPSKKKFRAIGTFVDQTGQIYVQRVSRRQPVAPVTVVRQLLDEKFRQSCPKERRATLRDGQECCVLWKDKSWYRARLVRLHQDEDEASVYLVDYGNFYRVKLEDIRSEVYAQQIPIQALRVELAGVRPLGMENTWFETGLEYIQTVIDGQEIQVEMVDASRQPPTVNIKFSGGKIDLAKMLSIHEGELIEYEVGVNFPPSSRVAEERRRHYQGIEAVPARTYPERNPFILLQNSPAPPRREISHLDWTRSALKPGDVIPVNILDIITFNTVFVNSTDPPCQYLAEKMAEYKRGFSEFQKICRQMLPVLNPREGMLVAALFRDVNNGVGWYRAVIRDVQDSKIKVYFIDFGTTTILEDSRHIKGLSDKFARVPVVAIKVILPLENLEDEDITLTLMQEVIYSNERGVVVRISSLEDGGTVKGHLEVEETGEVLYHSIIKEGIVKSDYQ